MSERDYDLRPLREDEHGLTEEEVRVNRCSEAIQNALERFGCRLDVSVLVTARGCRPNLKVVTSECFQEVIDNV